jgi:hypothetical protein
MRAWFEGSMTGTLFERPTEFDREWTEPPWSSREASSWAYAGKRLWC